VVPSEVSSSLFKMMFQQTSSFFRSEDPCLLFLHAHFSFQVLKALSSKAMYLFIYMHSYFLPDIFPYLFTYLSTNSLANLSTYSLTHPWQALNRNNELNYEVVFNTKSMHVPRMPSMKLTFKTNIGHTIMIGLPCLC
jgi:hypothetical protein